MVVGGSGIGTTAWHQVKPLYEAGILEKVYSEGKKCDIPDENFNLISVPQGDYLVQDLIFDSLVSLSVEKYPEIIQSWGSHCYHTLKEFPEAKSVVNLYSAHPLVQKELLKGEYKSFGINPTNPYILKKFSKELEICDYIFIPSEFILNSLRKVGLDHKTKLVPFGVDLEKFKPGEKADNFKIIFVGSNWMRKGLIYLLGAWKKFMEEYKDSEAELIVAGSNAKFDNLPPNVKVGWVDDLVKEYQESSAFFLPTIEDGCPLATYEAMACGLPAVVSSNTGTYQHIFNGNNGFIVTPAKVNEIYEKIVYFYENPGEALRMGKNARKMAEAFPWERHEKEYLKFIEEI